MKYGFRYSTAEDWGRFRRLFEARSSYKLAGGCSAASPSRVRAVRRRDLRHGGLAAPLLGAAFIPLLQAPENVAGGAIILRGRYDIRGVVPTRRRWGSAWPAIGLGASTACSATIARDGVRAGARDGAICAAGLAPSGASRRAPSRPLGDDRGSTSGSSSCLLIPDRASLSGTGAARDDGHGPRSRRRSCRRRYFSNAQAPADRVCGAQLAGPARPADRADAGLRARPPRPHVRLPAVTSAARRC